MTSYISIFTQNIHNMNLTSAIVNTLKLLKVITKKQPG